ncbi:MAG TPA: alcohol dehydrogenase catalytic domain-containing protein [Phycisphaerae bacterium]|nr:alcohol dehydrogenase catalytic domain-containing protein [Phycisphaerae bacterium]
MRGVKILDAERVETRDWPDPVPQGEQVVVRIEAAAICGSDLHALYQRPGEKAFIPGHEGAGVVAAVDKPRRVKVGDRVCCTAFATCGQCQWCLAGKVVYCPAKRGFYGFGSNGFQAEYALVAESSLLPLPESVSFEQGCLILDPVGTPYWAHRQMGTCAMHTVAVFGLGPMGLGAVAIGAHLGARVIGVDPIAYRRGLAGRLGAAEVIDPADGDVAERLRALTGGLGPDRIVECSGSGEALHAALDAAGIEAQVALIGENAEATIRPSAHFIRKGVRMFGAWCYPLGEYANICRLYEAGLAAADMITHRFALERADEAYRTFAAGDTGKVIFLPGE